MPDVNKTGFEVRCPLCFYMVKVDEDGIVGIIKCPVGLYSMWQW